MKMLSRNHTIIAATLAAVTFGLPSFAQAHHAGGNSYLTYEECKKKDRKNQVVGGLVGAVAGGVFGSQVSGNGARSEGSAIGALVGGTAGALIGDDKRHCEELLRYGQPSGYSSGGHGHSHHSSPPRYQPVPTHSYHTVSTPTYSGCQTCPPPRVYKPRPRPTYTGCNTCGYTQTTYPTQGHSHSHSHAHYKKKKRRKMRKHKRRQQQHHHYHGSNICRTPH